MNQKREELFHNTHKAKPLSSYKKKDAPKTCVSKKICVTHGANQEYYQLTGLSVGEVKEKLRDAMNVPSNASAYVFNELVNDDYIIQENDRIEFLKEAGVKGGSFN